MSRKLVTVIFKHDDGNSVALAYALDEAGISMMQLSIGPVVPEEHEESLVQR